MSAQIINFTDFKQGRYEPKEVLTIEDCIKELDEMILNATPRQQMALSLGINLMLEYMKGMDDLK